MNRIVLGLMAALACASTARAEIVLLAQGQLTASRAGPYADLSGLTGPLENGQRGDLLGGLGSGLAWAGGTTFLAAPDRGPNAVAYNPKVDNTTSYIDRFHTLTLALVPSPGGPLPFDLKTALTKTTLLYSAGPLAYGSGDGLGLPPGAPPQNTASRHYFTGRSDNFGPNGSGDPANARLDPEAIRVSNDGKSVFVSDEYGPYVRRFDRATGRLLNTYALPADLAVAHQAPTGAAEISGNSSGRTANKGMEGLALTPDGKTLVGIVQDRLLQDAGVEASARLLRLVTLDLASGATHEYGYRLTTGSGVSEIVAINGHEFLVDERDGKGLGDKSAARVKHLFRIDIAGARDITGLRGAEAAASPVPKSAAPVLDIVAELGAHGVPADQVPAKIEGLAFGADVQWRGRTFHTLYIANDNDFLADEGGPNRVFVFGFEASDLPGFVPQQIAGPPRTPR